MAFNALLHKRALEQQNGGGGGVALIEPSAHLVLAELPTLHVWIRSGVQEEEVAISLALNDLAVQNIGLEAA